MDELVLTKGLIARHVEFEPQFGRGEKVDPVNLNFKVGSGVAVLAEIPLRSPRKLFVFIIKKIICWVKESKKKIN